MTVQCTPSSHTFYMDCSVYTFSTHFLYGLFSAHLLHTLYIWTIQCTPPHTFYMDCLGHTFSTHFLYVFLHVPSRNILNKHHDKIFVVVILQWKLEVYCVISVLTCQQWWWDVYSSVRQTSSLLHGHALSQSHSVEPVITQHTNSLKSHFNKTH